MAAGSIWEGEMKNYVILVLATVFSLFVKAQAAEIDFDQGIDVTGIVQGINADTLSGDFPEPERVVQPDKGIIHGMDYAFNLRVGHYEDNGRETLVVFDPDYNLLVLETRNR